MKLVLINLYPADTMARYLISAYVLKGYVDNFFEQDKDMTVEVLNFDAEDDASAISGKILERNPDCIGYSCYIWNIGKILDIVKTLKERSRCVHIFGGPEISVSAIQKMPDSSRADYYVIGEGERRLANLLAYIKNNNAGFEAALPDGVAYWDANGTHFKEDVSSITDLDEIPSIYLDGVIDDRLYVGQQAFLETQRGCKYKCKYCVYHKHLSGICYYSPQRVFKELDYLVIKKRILALRIFDAVFTSDLARAKEIVKHLIDMKENNTVLLSWIYWEFNYFDVDEEFIGLVSALRYRKKISNVNEISPKDTPQLYSDMLRGYTAINCIGIQSFSRKALRAVGRTGGDLEALKDFMDMARQYNIVLKIDLILGLPLETFDSYFEGLEFFLPFLKGTDHVLNIHRLQMLPGSDLAGLCDTYEIRYLSKAPHTVFSTQSFSEKDLERAAKLSAVLFRVINSPLRRRFFDALEKTGMRCYDLINRIFNSISASQELKDIRLLRTEYTYDDYWNKDIFHEIPSKWLLDLLKSWSI